MQVACYFHSTYKSILSSTYQKNGLSPLANVLYFILFYFLFLALMAGQELYTFAWTLLFNLLIFEYSGEKM